MLNGLFQFSLPFMPVSELQDLSMDWAPSSELIEQDITAFTSSLSHQITQNSQNALILETFVFMILFLWRAGGLMLVGMALYKLGILSAVHSRSFYLKNAFYSLTIGFPIVIYGMYMNFTMNWDFQYSMFAGSQFNYWGSLFIAYGAEVCSCDPCRCSFISLLVLAPTVVHPRSLLACGELFILC